MEGSLGECSRALILGALSTPENQTATAALLRLFEVTVAAVCLEIKIE
jgi:hypothetical protein